MLVTISIDWSVTAALELVHQMAKSPYFLQFPALLCFMDRRRGGGGGGRQVSQSSDYRIFQAFVKLLPKCNCSFEAEILRIESYPSKMAIQNKYPSQKYLWTVRCCVAKMSWTTLSIHDVFIRPTFVQVKITNFSSGNKKAKLYFCIIIITRKKAAYRPLFPRPCGQLIVRSLSEAWLPVMEVFPLSFCKVSCEWPAAVVSCSLISQPIEPFKTF